MKRKEGLIEQGSEKDPLNSKIKRKIDLRKRKHTIYGKWRAVVNLPSPGLRERPVYRSLGESDLLTDNHQRSEGKAEQLVIMAITCFCLCATALAGLQFVNWLKQLVRRLFHKRCQIYSIFYESKGVIVNVRSDLGS